MFSNYKVANEFTPIFQPKRKKYNVLNRCKEFFFREVINP